MHLDMKLLNTYSFYTLFKQDKTEKIDWVGTIERKCDFFVILEDL